ncbi:hypothetical protein A0H81_09577 [Grifola frondosa]|uniref:Uncharacterized protein n=1 Tax=Grifola frondosa TaxID=5627 RepID=A0A1C7M232_GRIFR|nr:hypothetical protein A0H81_09577 [Grifola frondosa]
MLPLHPRSRLCSSPRPLPVPPRRTSTLIRPLPRPPVPARAQSTPEPPSRPQEPLSPSRCSSESASSSKALLRLDIPATCPNEIHLKTPVTPLSPISFSFPGPKPLRKKREHTLERHMKQLGFVEAPPPLLSSKSFVKSHPPDRDVVLLVNYEVDQANVPFRSTSRCGNGDEFEVQVLQADEPVRIQRFSRKWSAEVAVKPIVFVRVL